MKGGILDHKNWDSGLRNDRIEQDKIILDGQGKFPKDVIILEANGEKKEYRIIKTRNGGYILNR
jgi:hypothetical protein